MVQASKEWQWQLCSHRNRLLVDLGEDLSLCTPFRQRQLTQDIVHSPNFSLNEAGYYQNVFAYLCKFAVWSEAQCCQIALNATAAKFYLLPVQAKSWFFHPYQGGEACTEAIISLHSKTQTGEFFIVEYCEESSLCINLTANFKLDEHLELEQFQAIKVLNDRIHPLVIADKIIKSA
ncbi:cell division protein ZapC [Pseudoalteromonas sp. MSK9-3]|uniref:cell division protein ZapC domain-containing protein n=1 Tax=Pseudoalteromonas sp. MSK9-3 TaxID=1897633 RepID=UPI000E6C3944|nr:cell division protein ZapC domain-containing protein [Pseudoalteromonas sp. MSK9-3]RJE77648.1 cell division protein ZapC [Pseudoalteromonas sp. MSK9-3]